MQRVISLLFVLIMVFSIFSVPISAREELEVVENIEKIEMFEYYYKNEGTFEILESVLAEYNKKYGYDREREIRIGTGSEEFTVAEFNEEKIVIYCSDLEKSSIRDSDKFKYLRTFYKAAVEEIDVDLVDSFIRDLNKYNNYCGSLILPMVIRGNHNQNSIYFLYRLLEPFLDILNIILTIVLLGFLIYTIISLIYNKIKKKEIKNIRRKIVLSVLSIIYLLLGGLNVIIAFILSLFSLV